MSQIEATRDQIEATIDALRDRSSDAIGAVQHGVGSITSKIGSRAEPEPKHWHRSKFLWLVVGAVVVSVAAFFMTRRARSGVAETEQWTDRTAADDAPAATAPRAVRSA